MSPTNSVGAMDGGIDLAYVAAFPGMGTGVGRMHPVVAAAQMRRGFEATFAQWSG